MNKQKIESLLAAYNSKSADTEKSKTKARSLGPETRMILILSVFDDRSAKWTYDLLVEQGVLHQETDSKKKANQIRKVSGWISEIRVRDMKLPPLRKGLVQPPDMAVARQRWDALNPRPSDEMILSGEWKGTAADYSDLDLSSRQQGGKNIKKGKGSSSQKKPPEPHLSDPSPKGNLTAKVGESVTGTAALASEEQVGNPMNQQMQRIAEEMDNGGAVVIPRKRKRPHVSLPNAFKS